MKKLIGKTRSGKDENSLPQRNTVSARQNLSSGTRFTEYGFIYEDGQSIPPEYLVRITSYRNNCTIIAPMQEPIPLSVQSVWEPVIPTSILRQANVAAQALSTLEGKETKGTITSATTRRIWSGTSPITIPVKLKFEAIKNPFMEVVEPCRLLQALALPSEPEGDGNIDLGPAAEQLKSGNVWGSFTAAIGELSKSLICPPGPSPFLGGVLPGNSSYFNKSQEDVDSSRRGGDFIMLEFGTFLTFWNVIVKEGSLLYDVKFDQNGLPVSAFAEITFETYEMPTRESLLDSYSQVKNYALDPDEN